MYLYQHIYTEGYTVLPAACAACVLHVAVVLIQLMQRPTCASSTSLASPYMDATMKTRFRQFGTPNPASAALSASALRVQFLMLRAPTQACKAVVYSQSSAVLVTSSPAEHTTRPAAISQRLQCGNNLLHSWFLILCPIPVQQSLNLMKYSRSHNARQSQNLNKPKSSRQITLLTKQRCYTGNYARIKFVAYVFQQHPRHWTKVAACLIQLAENLTDEAGALQPGKHVGYHIGFQT